MLKSLKELEQSDLGNNVYALDTIIKKFSNGVFVDLGVRGGVSSTIMLYDAEIKNNKVYGVDVVDSSIDPSVKNHSNYNFILGDSVTIGKKWKNEKIDVLFIDTLHVKEQVLCELHYWMPHMKQNSYIIFHDCNWPQGKHDYYGNIKWDRVEQAIKEYFNIIDLNNNTESIKSVLLPDSWGMCIIKILQHNSQNNINWDNIFTQRNKLMSLLWNNNNIENRDIDIVC